VNISFVIKLREENHIVVTVTKSNRKIIERDKINNPTKQILDQSLSWLGRGIAMKSGGVNLVLAFPLSEMMW